MNSPVFKFAAEEPEMVAAIERAHATFKYFWRELYWERRRIVPAFSGTMVKIAFTDGPGLGPNPEVEQMWVTDVNFNGQNLTGVLMNSPNWLTSVKEGDEISASLDRLADWMIVLGDKAYGAFTVNAIRSKMATRERASHDQAWGLDFGVPTNTRFIISNESYTEQPSGSNDNRGLLGRLFGSKTNRVTEEPKHELPTKFSDHLMCVNMLPNIQKQLDQNKTIVNEVDEEGWALLHHEALAGNAAIIKLLIANGANPRLKTNLGMTPAMLAHSIGWKSIAAGLEKLCAPKPS